MTDIPKAIYRKTVFGRGLPQAHVLREGLDVTAIHCLPGRLPRFGPPKTTIKERRLSARYSVLQQSLEKREIGPRHNPTQQRTSRTSSTPHPLSTRMVLFHFQSLVRKTEGSISSSSRKNGALNSFVTVIDWANALDDSPKGRIEEGWLTISLLIFVPGIPGSFIEVIFLLMSVSHTNL